MKMMWNVREQGEFGIGSLIIFIAMIIVAAVTATLLINVAYSLQQQAEQTSQEAIQDVSTGLKIISMGGYRYNSSWGTGAPYRNTIDWITIKITLIAGSSPVNISSVILEVTDGYTVVTLYYDKTFDFNPTTRPPPFSGDVFGTRKIRDMGEENKYILTQGDISEIYFNATGLGLNLEPQSQLSLKIIPKHGVPVEKDLITPSPYIARYVELM